MNVASLDRLQKSFDSLAPQMDRMTGVFYERLFQTRPDTRALFTLDMETQRRHLAAALAMIIRNMRMLDALEEPLRDLGARHARVGVMADHYPPVVEAMTFALADTLGGAWNDQLAADWNQMLGRIAGQMLRGAEALSA